MILNCEVGPDWVFGFVLMRNKGLAMDWMEFGDWSFDILDECTYGAHRSK